MLPVRAVALTSLAMLAFAGNSLLCRLALAHTAIDPAGFTAIRLLSGAVMLSLAVRLRGGPWAGRGNWISALALFAYAIAFSFAYVGLSAATGALLLFGAVQATMIGVGIRRGERLHAAQLAGLALAVAGLVTLLLPGLTAPPAGRAALMLGAGVAWGVYSLRGQGAGEATAVNAGNFLRAVPVALLLCLLLPQPASTDLAGVGYAVASGALASGVGYAIWYAALPSLRSTTAAVVQLSVPALAALGGALLLGEPITARVVLASVTILGGIAIVVLGRRRA
ncbi:MAG TPA: DMT family transporter [Steroidobacteraceae bacterium]|nr:DMT family transporter [Steroidobacteraceae bacterium]